MNQIKSNKHNILRKAVISGHIDAVIEQIINLGDEKKEIININPSGENSLLYL